MQWLDDSLCLEPDKYWRGKVAGEGDLLGQTGWNKEETTHETVGRQFETGGEIQKGKRQIQRIQGGHGGG